MLDWIGDIGGLYDGLIGLIRLFIGPFTTFIYRTELLERFFNVPSRSSEKNTKSCLKEWRIKRKMHAKADAIITKQLDLVKFVKQQRLLLAVALVNLNSPQQRIVRNLS